MRNRLCRIYHFSRDIGFGRNQCFDHRVEWLPGLTVPEIEEAILSGGADTFDRSPVTRDVKKNWSGDMVPVPKIMVHGLVIPLEFSGFEV